ncbi:MAG: 50S ribosomal protein L22, partial [Candidatus Auribacterota bacterium]|nr:50S ribosomal protein L22 [Candidatus Auribacterota bacterium]
MEAKAITKYVRVSVRKAKPLMESIRGQGAEKALKILSFSAKKVAKAIEKTVKSAIANAKSKEEKPSGELYVKEAYATEGPTLRRFITRAHGRATRVRKRTSHITIIIAEKDKAISEKAPLKENSGEKQKTKNRKLKTQDKKVK